MDAIALVLVVVTFWTIEIWWQQAGGQPIGLFLCCYTYPAYLGIGAAIYLFLRVGSQRELQVLGPSDPP